MPSRVRSRCDTPAECMRHRSQRAAGAVARNIGLCSAHGAMASPIDFHFDFSSPYSYIASEEIEALAERIGSELRWRPLLLGAVFKTSGGHPLTEGYGP